jgi:hypothetical protein
MSTSELPAGSRYVHVATPDLRAGDIVLTHGMRVRLDTLAGTHPTGHPEHAHRTVYAWHGTVTNPDDVRREGLVPLAWWRDGWTVQGNHLASWLVIRDDAAEVDAVTDRPTLADYCPGHESLRGDAMGVSVYCDGSCLHGDELAEALAELAEGDAVTDPTSHTVTRSKVSAQSLRSLRGWLDSRGTEELGYGVAALLAELEAGHDVTIARVTP